MTLQVTQSEHYAIAMRYLYHQIDTENGYSIVSKTIMPYIDDKDQFIYVKKELVNLLIKIQELADQVLEESKKTDIRKMLLDTKLMTFELKFKWIVGETLTTFSSKAERLVRLRTKLDPIINNLSVLATIPLSEQAKNSIENKKQKVQMFMDSVPTLAQISTVLRIDELQNSNIVKMWAGILADHILTNSSELLATEGLSKDLLDNFLVTTEETARTTIYTHARNLCNPVLEDSEEKNTFLESTLKQSTEKFITATRNRNAVKQLTAEIIADSNLKLQNRNGKLQELLETQKRTLDYFKKMLVNSYSSIEDYFLNRALEDDIVTASLSDYPGLKVDGFVVEELAQHSKDIYNLVISLDEKYYQKVKIDSIEKQAYKLFDEIEKILKTISQE